MREEEEGGREEVKGVEDGANFNLLLFTSTNFSKF